MRSHVGTLLMILKMLFMLPSIRLPSVKDDTILRLLNVELVTG